MLFGIFLLILTVWGIKVSYHCFRYQNVYWAYPTISGFRDRKKRKDAKWISYFEGILAVIGAAVVSAYTAYYFWQLLYH